MAEFEKTERNRVRRLPKRGEYDKDTVYRIIDEALICHVGFVKEDGPFVIPTIHARMGDAIVLHGSKGNRLLNHIQAGNEVCITVTLVDGLVLARSVFHHSMNYRSVVLFGKGEIVSSKEEKLKALEIITEHVMPGRWKDARGPNEKELASTTVVSIPIESASAKIRTGPPIDDDEDYSLPVWAGILPLIQRVLPPEDDPDLGDGISLPEYIVDYCRKFQS